MASESKIKKIKKGDLVIITAGKERGKRGKVIKVLPRAFRVIVEGVNLKPKHVKPKGGGKKGEIIQLPLSVSVSSVSIFCSKCGRASRIKFFRASEGIRKRICHRCKEEI